MSTMRDRDSSAIKSLIKSRYVRITSVVALYWFVSITLTFVNQRILSGNLTFTAPIFVTWFQCVVTVALLYMLQAVFAIFPKLKIPGFPDCLEVKIPTLRQVLPLSMVFVLMITSNSLCTKYLGVSFYCVGSPLSMAFNVLLTRLILGSKTSLGSLSCCAVMIVGFWLGVDPELVFPMGFAKPLGNPDAEFYWGVFYGVTYTFFVAANAICTKKMLTVVEENIWQLSLYNCVNASFLLLLPLILINGEVQNVTSDEKYLLGLFWVKLFTSGMFGFAIGYVTILQIQVTSPLTHSVSGVAKAAAQTVLVTQYLAENRDVVWWLSNALVLCGSVGYTRTKQLEMGNN